MSVVENYTWLHKTGRDGDGDKFSVSVLAHTRSNLIVARVIHPVNGDEYKYRVWFDCVVPKKVLDNDPAPYDFLDLESARRFVWNVLGMFDPPAVTALNLIGYEGYNDVS